MFIPGFLAEGRDVLKPLRLALTLALFCIVAAGALALVYILTSPLIKANAERSFIESLKSVLPADDFKLIKEGEAVVYTGTKGGQLIGHAVKVAPRGYSGAIELLVGIDRQGKVSGVKVLQQKETPGLGTNVVKPDWLKQFLVKPPTAGFEVKKDIQAVAGATISSRAVVSGVNQALRALTGAAK
jgi:electron transport complex protein RnfG